jgi:hypothetical protein
LATSSTQLIDCVRDNFPPTTRLAVLGTVQFIAGVVAAVCSCEHDHADVHANDCRATHSVIVSYAAVHTVREELGGSFASITVPQAKPLSSGEVLGCTSPTLVDVDAYVFVADGRFHLEVRWQCVRLSAPQRCGQRSCCGVAVPLTEHDDRKPQHPRVSVQPVRQVVHTGVLRVRSYDDDSEVRGVDRRRTTRDAAACTTSPACVPVRACVQGGCGCCQGRDKVRRHPGHARAAGQPCNPAARGGAAHGGGQGPHGAAAVRGDAAQAPPLRRRRRVDSNRVPATVNRLGQWL